jgi:hypothetical protein
VAVGGIAGIIGITPTSGGLMEDPQIHGTIERLVAEEHELWERESDGNASDADRRRLQELKVSLDQSWDLLRQRRALREAGRDPDAADVRQPEVVERYQQ